MGLTSAENMEDKEVRDRYLERFHTELGKCYDSSHPNEKGPKVDQVCLPFQLLTLTLIVKSIPLMNIISVRQSWIAFELMILVHICMPQDLKF